MLANASIGGEHGNLQLVKKPSNCWELQSSKDMVLVVIVLVLFLGVSTGVDTFVQKAHELHGHGVFLEGWGGGC